jgi:hypothetical protein
VLLQGNHHTLPLSSSPHSIVFVSLTLRLFLSSLSLSLPLSFSLYLSPPHLLLYSLSLSTVSLFQSFLTLPFCPLLISPFCPLFLTVSSIRTCFPLCLKIPHLNCLVEVISKDTFAAEVGILKFTISQNSAFWVSTSISCRVWVAQSVPSSLGRLISLQGKFAG